MSTIVIKGYFLGWTGAVGAATGFFTSEGPTVIEPFPARN
jgi:hypothetical protein